MLNIKLIYKFCSLCKVLINNYIKISTDYSMLNSFYND